MISHCLRFLCFLAALSWLGFPTHAAEPMRIKLGGVVRSVAFSPDGKTLLTGSQEETALKLWDSATGKEAVGIPGMKHGVTFAIFSPDGKTIAAGGGDNVIYLFDVASPAQTPPRQLKGHEKVVTCTAFAPDGKTIATGSQDNTVRIWDIATGKELSQLKEPDAVNAIAYSSDGKFIVSAGWFPLVHVWDVASRVNVRQCVGHRGAVSTIAFAPDGKTFATAGEDRSIRIWELFSGKEIRQLDEHPEQVNALAYCSAAGPGAPLLASGSGDRTVRLWDIAGAKEVQRFTEHQGPVFALAFSADGKRLASAGSDQRVVVHDVTDVLRTLGGQPAELTTRQLETMWKGLASGNPRQAYRAIWTLNAAPRQTMALFQEKLTPFATTADKQRITQLLADLNDDRFEVREKATRDLENLGEIVEAVLQKSLMGFLPSLEVRRRIERILEKIKAGKGTGPSSEVLRALRAVTILESLASPDARQLLEKFANGMPDAQLTQDAKAALDRLARRK